MNTHIRDTFISQEAFDAIPANRQQGILALVKEYQGLGYISGWDIGADQAARMSKREIEKQQKTRLRVFRIEEQVKELLKTDEQLQKDQEQRDAKALANRRQYLQNRIKQIEEFLPRQLASKRNNIVKSEYQGIKEELSKLC